MTSLVRVKDGVIATGHASSVALWHFGGGDGDGSGIDDHEQVKTIPTHGAVEHVATTPTGHLLIVTRGLRLTLMDARAEKVLDTCDLPTAARVKYASGTDCLLIWMQHGTVKIVTLRGDALNVQDVQLQQTDIVDFVHLSQYTNNDIQKVVRFAVLYNDHHLCTSVMVYESLADQLQQAKLLSRKQSHVDADVVLVKLGTVDAQRLCYQQLHDSEWHTVTFNLADGGVQSRKCTHQHMKRWVAAVECDDGGALCADVDGQLFRLSPDGACTLVPSAERFGSVVAMTWVDGNEDRLFIGSRQSHLVTVKDGKITGAQ